MQIQNKKGIAPSQTGIVWTVIIAAIILLIAGFIGFNSINNKVNTKTLELQNSVDNKVNGIEGTVNSLEVSLTSAVNELRTTAAGIDTSVDVDGISEICDEVDGCGGFWDVPSDLREDYSDRVLDELTESDNRDLFKEIEDLVDIDDNEDIVYSFVDQIGDVRTNQDPDRGFNDDKVVTVDMVLEVEFYPDGENDDTKTKHFRVQGTIDDLEDGIFDSDVKIDSVEKVSSSYTLP